MAKPPDRYSTAFSDSTTTPVSTTRGSRYEGIFDEKDEQKVESKDGEVTILPGDSVNKDMASSLDKASKVAGDLVPAAAGAITGNVLSKYGAQPYNITPEFKAAQAKTKAADITSKELQKFLQGIDTSQLTNVNQLQSIHDTQLSQLNKMRERAIAAHAKAASLDALPPGTPGDKWSATSAAMGSPGGDTVSDAARNSRMTKAMSVLEGTGEAAKFSVNREGIIVPNKKSNALTDVQKIARQEYTVAQALYDAKMAEYAKVANDLKKLQASTPPGRPQAAKDAQSALTSKLIAEANLKDLTPTPSFAERMIAKVPGGQTMMDYAGKANTALSTTPVLKYALPTLGGGFGAVQGLEGIEDYSKGNQGEGALKMLSGAGGILGSMPHPYARAAGALAQIPLLGYEGYQYAKKKLSE